MGPTVQFLTPEKSISGGSNKWLDYRPFHICQIACVALIASITLLASGFGPGHRDLHHTSEIRLNHNLLKSLNPFGKGS